MPSVMAGLVPGHPRFRNAPDREDVDARDKRGHDDGDAQERTPWI